MDSQEVNEKVVPFDMSGFTGKPMWLTGWARWGSRMVGNVFGNPLFDDGSIVTTSDVQYFYAVAVTKSGSHYILDGSRVAYEAIGQE